MTARLQADADGQLFTQGLVASLQLNDSASPPARTSRVGDPAVLKAELRIAETQAKDIQIGQTAAIDTRNGVIPGHVTRIDPAVENGTVTVDVALDGELPRGTRPDLTVDGTIDPKRMDDVLFVGRPVFGQEESVVSLFRVEEGRDVWTDVLCEPADTLSRPPGAVLPASWPLLIVRLVSCSCCPPVVTGRRLSRPGGRCERRQPDEGGVHQGGRRSRPPPRRGARIPHALGPACCGSPLTHRRGTSGRRDSAVSDV